VGVRTQQDASRNQRRWKVVHDIRGQRSGPGGGEEIFERARFHVREPLGRHTDDAQILKALYGDEQPDDEGEQVPRELACRSNAYPTRTVTLRKK